MNAQPLYSTPSAPLLRVSSPLQWEFTDGHAPDGQLEMRSDANGVPTTMLLKQPHRPGKHLGVSFFLPTCDQHILDAVHKLMGRCSEALGRGASVPGTPLPPPLQLVNDHSFSLRLPGYGPAVQRIVIGQHYTLFAAEDMPVSEFERHYDQLMRTFQQYSIEVMRTAAVAAAEAAEAVPLTTLTSLLDPQVMPADPSSAAAVIALEALAKRSSGNTAFFAALFALDMRSSDTDFEDVLEGCANRAALVAVALEQHVVRDPLWREDVLDAQEALAACFPGYKPRWCKYEPYWVSVACDREQAGVVWGKG